MADGSFATAINCMDGRTQKPVADWLIQKFGVDHIDAITEPGVDRVLTQGAAHQIQSVRERVLISINAHGSRHVVVVGHHDCAGNPVSREEHHRMTRDAVEVVARWNLPVRIFGLWVDENWEIEVIHER